MLLILIILTFLLGFTACVLAMVSMSSAVPTVGEQISEESALTGILDCP